MPPRRNLEAFTYVAAGKQNKDVVFMLLHQLKGGSQAQSSSIQCFDAALGLVHPPGKLTTFFRLQSNFCSI